MGTVASLLAEHVALRVRSVDRIGVAGYIPPNPRLCIPDLMLNDAGQGVGDQEINTTAYPSAIAQASSWDRSLQRTFGRALGSEAWHKGVNVQLAPDINIARFPMNGRTRRRSARTPTSRARPPWPRSGASRRTRSSPRSSTTRSTTTR